MKILLTGFSPFGEEKINPSFEAIKNIDKNYKGNKIDIIEVDTVYDDCVNQVLELHNKNEYDVILMFGQAGGRKGITPERVAINIKEASIPDNYGKLYNNEIIDIEGPDGIFTNININHLVSNLKSNKIDAFVSNSAGTYVCNNLYYGILFYILRHKSNTRALFTHVPFIDEQVIEKKDIFSMPLSEINRAIYIIIDSVTKG